MRKLFIWGENMTYFACRKSDGGNSKKLLTIPLDGETIKTTEKAYGLKINGQMIWLPKSQTADVEEKDGTFSVWLPMWLITEKSLEIFIDTSYEPSLFD